MAAGRENHSSVRVTGAGIPPHANDRAHIAGHACIYLSEAACRLASMSLFSESKEAQEGGGARPNDSDSSGHPLLRGRANRTKYDYDGRATAMTGANDSTGTPG